MIKVTIFVIVVLIAVAYSNDPSFVKPWREAAGHVGVLVTQMIKETGATANKSLRDEVSKER